MCILSRTVGTAQWHPHWCTLDKQTWTHGTVALTCSKAVPWSPLGSAEPIDATGPQVPEVAVGVSASHHVTLLKPPLQVYLWTVGMQDRQPLPGLAIALNSQKHHHDCCQLISSTPVQHSVVVFFSMYSIIMSEAVIMGYGDMLIFCLLSLWGLSLFSHPEISSDSSWLTCHRWQPLFTSSPHALSSSLPSFPSSHISEKTWFLGSCSEQT